MDDSATLMGASELGGAMACGLVSSEYVARRSYDTEALWKPGLYQLGWVAGSTGEVAVDWQPPSGATTLAWRSAVILCINRSVLVPG